MRVVRVNELPWPWNPFRCQWRDRFAALIADRDLGDTERATLFQEMATSLSPKEIKSCRFHDADWSVAADVAVDIFRQGMSPDTADLGALVQAVGGGAVETDAVRSFWMDPITWSPGSPFVGNGQHRICALKLAGAPAALAEP